MTNSVATTAVRPAAGPLTLVFEPLKAPTIMPPTMPAKIPAYKGAFEAKNLFNIYDQDALLLQMH